MLAMEFLWLFLRNIWIEAEMIRAATLWPWHSVGDVPHLHETGPQIINEGTSSSGHAS